MTWKKFMASVAIGLLLGVIVAPAFAAVDNSLDAKPTAYWWTGNPTKDTALLAAREVEDMMEGSAAFDTGIWFNPTDTEPTATEGMFYYDDSENALKLYTGSSWVALEAGTTGSLDTSYGLGSTIDVDADALTFTTSDTDNNEVMALVQNEATNDNNALSITFGAGATGTGVAINSQTGGTDISGDNWSVAQTGALACVGITSTAGDILFDDTYDLSWDTSRDQLLFEDNAVLGIGGAHDAAGDFTLTYDGTDLLMEAAAADDVWKLGATNNFDIIIYGDTATDLITFDTSAELASFNGFDIRLNDADILVFGDDSDVTIAFDNAGDDLDILADDSELSFGADGAGMDIIWHSETAGDLVTFDEDNVEVYFTDIDIQLDDDADLILGTGNDFTIDSDTAKTLDVTPAGATDDYVINFGLDQSGIDINFFGTTASDGLFWDAGNDTLTVTHDSTLFTCAEAAVNQFKVDATGTGAGNVIVFETTDGGIQLNADGGANGDIDIDAASAIAITAAGGAAEDLVITNTAGSATLTAGEAIADAIVINASAGGMDITTAATFDIDITATGGRILGVASEAAADQFKIDAQGTVAGDAINLETTNGGILLNADGADNGDIGVNAADDMTLTAAGDLTFAVTGTMSAGGAAFANLTMTQTNDADGEALAATDSGEVFTNIGDADGQNYTLPGAAAGLKFTFVVVVAQTLNINPVDGTDTILGLTNAAGDSVESNAIGDTITLYATDATNWVVLSTNNSNGNADAWADAN